MASKLQVEMRRQKVKELIVRGFSNTDIADQLNVHRHTVERDVEAIKREIQKQIEEKPIEETFFKLKLRYEVMNQRYWEMIDQTDNDFVKLRALNGLMGLTFRWVKMLERLGIVDKEEIIRKRREAEPRLLDTIGEVIKELMAEERKKD